MRAEKRCCIIEMIFVPAEAVTFGMGVSALQLLERRIAEDGVVLPGGILKVDGFLNHLMDPVLFTEMARELYRLYGGEGVNKILTIEASGIGLACITGQVFGCPVLFAKKNRTRNLFGDSSHRRPYQRQARQHQHHPGLEGLHRPRGQGAHS